MTTSATSNDEEVEDILLKAEIILCMHPTKERRRYNEMLSVIGWGYTQNDHCERLDFSDFP